MGGTPRNLAVPVNTWISEVLAKSPIREDVWFLISAVSKCLHKRHQKHEE